MMKKIKINKLGLAAFVKTMGDKENTSSFIGYEDNHFIFESELSEIEWRIAYTKHICSVFDKNLMDLREFMSENKNNRR